MLTSKPRRSQASLECPPDLTVPACDPDDAPRRASLASLVVPACQLQRGGGLHGSAPCLDLDLGDKRLSFRKAGLSARQRSGSISSFNGKEELRDYHQRQRGERLREQEVQSLQAELEGRAAELEGRAREMSDKEEQLQQQLQLQLQQQQVMNRGFTVQHHIRIREK